MSTVSIIIPNYNGASFLKETIESCLQQNQELISEIIVVDDHSSDGSWPLIQSLEKQCSKIRGYRNPKKGANSARNYGFSKSTGAYIKFLDADDLLSPNKIESQLEVLKNSPSGTVANCGWAQFRSAISEAQFSPNKVWKDYDRPYEWLIDSWTGGGMMVTSCWLSPRDLIEKADHWDETLLKNQDGEFFCRVLLKACAVRFVETAKVYYRKPQKNNVSQRLSAEAAESLLRSYESYERQIRKKQDTEDVRQACATNYQGFIYQFHPKYPQLLEKARLNIKKLGVKKRPEVGGRNFRKLAKLLGTNNALRIRQLTRF